MFGAGSANLNGLIFFCRGRRDGDASAAPAKNRGVSGEISLRNIASFSAKFRRRHYPDIYPLTPNRQSA